jgi:flavin reductase (DIM6/NTAB) family NADH-FMN oxidoreductase RutF
MFYRPADGHPLPRNPFKACVVPRPIGWISTLSPAGVPNLAPYSFFNAVADTPPVVMFASNGHQPHGPKDSADNAVATGAFVANLATWDLKEAMNATSADAAPDVDEFALAGLTAAPCREVAAPRVAETPIALECRTLSFQDLPAPEGGRNRVVFGEVVGVHIDERVLSGGFVDVARVKPISRLGYKDYAVVLETFSMDRPGGGDRLAGLA